MLYYIRGTRIPACCLGYLFIWQNFDIMKVNQTCEIFLDF